ncbi:uncharacterized protein LOC111673979 [Orussus abietinus]|uniref:uncharacterized protein LOC111673979 n=1 Tax=Orussus abietinus TaxID=222816 RepID=UPI000C715FAF|nr:uncharacterized protein LOC111673979 [Orussus abietinus]
MIRKMKSLFSENDKPPETLENASAAEDVQNQLYWIFHGLEICLRKYEVLSSDQREVVGDNEPQFVTDSWKRLWKNGKKCGQRKNLEEEWISVLEEIMMANLDNCTLISTQAWQCLNILREIQDRKKTVTEGINYT